MRDRERSNEKTLGEGSPGVLLSDDAHVTERQASLIERLSPEDRERVRRHGTALSFARGALMFDQGDAHNGIMIIESGLVRSYYTAPTGREITLAYWSAGNFVGGPEIFGGGTHMWAAAAARKTTVTHLPGEGLRALAREVPDLALGIIDALVFKASCYSALAQMLGTRSLTERLVELLDHLAATYGIEEPGGIAIATAFTHAEIANLIGGTRQWVTISLNKLQTAGALTQNKGMLVIKRRDLLTIDTLKLK